MRLYIIRHAEPDYPRDALTARGHAQARALADRLSAMGIDRVYSSPMNRALETARYTAERLGLEVQVESWTRELEDWWVPDQALGERPVWQVDAATLRALAPGQEIWPPDALAQLHSASDEFLGRHENASSQGIAVFCHAGFALTWLAALLAVPLPLMWAGFSLPPASITTVVFEKLAGGDTAARCLGLGNVALTAF
ncbi:MAG TPA: histidine phosphatase family protein [Thermoanaerobaculia bacterium]|jgi:probable phosphoglycerate mutase|nr:histidine phosphatase family protein [Thermoanaerobaculia bacterium]